MRPSASAASRADVDAQVPVRARGGAAAPRLDDDQLGAAPARARSTSGQMWRLVVMRSAPQEMTRSESHHGLGIGAADAAARRVPARLRAGVAHRARLEPRGAERVEEPEQQAAVELALVRAVGVAEQRERPVLADDAPASAPTISSSASSQRDRREAPLALGAGAAQRRQHALRRVHQLVLAVHLGAGEARRHRMLGIALQLEKPPVLDVAMSEHWSGQSCAHAVRMMGIRLPSRPQLARRAAITTRPGRSSPCPARPRSGP